ncbi:BAG family molecular chaperone regulator 7 [Dendrobium catenatum]|uniref:BAG family molecular chaperone regulator 7 n=2 Tax=Dendrobium catenatum TaxID=906689 RepID=A0A2I0WNG4_9ASPA|nr:BAG family molecular chaperone regulator 7 [Dendrobium catenatum]
MMRAAKKSIIDELEIMLEVVDPQPATGKLGSLRRRKFDLPDGVLIPREIARNVAQVVDLIDEHGEDGASA